MAEIANPRYEILTPSDIEQLTRLFETVEFDRTDLPEREPFLQVNRGKHALLFVGEALQCLRALQQSLSMHALESGGYLPNAIENHLIRACCNARDDSLVKALAELDRTLQEGPSEWRIIANCEARHRPRDMLLGRCAIKQEIPSELNDLPFGSEDLTPPVIETTVLARDQQSAELKAMDRFDEVHAILGLGDLTPLRDRPTLAAINSQDQIGVRPSTTALIHVDAIVNQPAENYPPLHPGYQQLADQLGVASAARSDWPRRVIAAARWLRKAHRSQWTAESLVAAMTALECLFIRDKSEDAKGSLIASRATDVAVFAGFEAEEQRCWFRDLYSIRNGAIHEGEGVSRDLDVARLLDIAGYFGRWAVWHANPFHRIPNEPCSSFDEVMDSTLHSDSSR